MQYLKLYEDYKSQDTFKHPGFLRDPNQIYKWIKEHIDFYVPVPDDKVDEYLDYGVEIKEDGTVYIDAWRFYEKDLWYSWRAEDPVNNTADIDSDEFNIVFNEYYERDYNFHEAITVGFVNCDYIEVDIHLEGNLFLPNTYSLKGIESIEGGIENSSSKPLITSFPKDFYLSNTANFVGYLVLEDPEFDHPDYGYGDEYYLFKYPEEERGRIFFERVADYKEPLKIIENLYNERPDLYEKYIDLAETDIQEWIERLKGADKHKYIMDL